MIGSAARAYSASKVAAEAVSRLLVTQFVLQNGVRSLTRRSCVAGRGSAMARKGEKDREIPVWRQRLSFIIQEWQQTGRDDDFLLRGFDLVPGAEVCTRRTRAGIQEGGPIQEISWLHGPCCPRLKAIGPEMKGVDVSFAGTANRWRVLRCDVITCPWLSANIR